MGEREVSDIVGLAHQVLIPNGCAISRFDTERKTLLPGPDKQAEALLRRPFN